MSAKSFFKTLWSAHGAIGKFCTLFCCAAFVAAIFGLITGTTKCSSNHTPSGTNHFINENVLFHNENYDAKVMQPITVESINTIDKDGNTDVKEGHFVSVLLQITQNENSKLKPHKFDCNDFKLKDHTGVYIPLNSIMGAVGWDAIDVHYDTKDGGHVISSASFSTRNAIKDYVFFDTEISSGTTVEFPISFELDSQLFVEKEIMVLEIDFYTGNNSYKEGVDIILLPNPIA